MGCVLCNIMNCESFGIKEKPEANPFYCQSEKEREAFLDELAGDIVSRHPEMVERITTLIAKKS